MCCCWRAVTQVGRVQVLVVIRGGGLGHPLPLATPHILLLLLLLLLRR
jgi:hypothetical protein